MSVEKALSLLVPPPPPLRTLHGMQLSDCGHKGKQTDDLSTQLRFPLLPTDRAKWYCRDIRTEASLLFARPAGRPAGICTMPERQMD